MTVEFSKENGLTSDRTVIKIADIDFSITSADPDLKIHIQETSKDFVTYGAKSLLVSWI